MAATPDEIHGNDYNLNYAGGFLQQVGQSDGLNVTMTGFDYAEIPACATLLQPPSGFAFSAVDRKRIVILPAPVNVANETSASGSSLLNANSPVSSSPSVPCSNSSMSSGSKFTNALLSSTLFLPTLPEAVNFLGNDQDKLLSNREPLSLPTTTVNFRRFVSRSGPVFWLQDRAEEIIMWKKGWKPTCVWMAFYGLLCIFPRLFLLLPNIVFISILLATHKSVSDPESLSKPSSNVLPKEGSTEWFSNLQAIQNLMGIVSDAHDTIIPWLPILTWNSPYTTHLFTSICLLTLFLLPILSYVPLTPILLVVGLLPLFCTHPVISRFILLVLPSLLSKRRNLIQRLIDNDNLSESHWHAMKREVELIESERWSASLGWSKASLKHGEKPWSSSYFEESNQGNDISDLMFTLPYHWDFIPSESWRPDYNGGYVHCGVDENGWVYYDDLWQSASNIPLDDWKSKGMTRRRRWTHRIYYAPA